MVVRCAAFVLCVLYFVVNVSTLEPPSGYKPVVIVHGILDKKTSLDFMADRIRQIHPGTNTVVVDLLHGKESLAPMWKQVDAFGTVVKQISSEHPRGIHLLCFSQGGLICRGIVETFSVLNVATFVSLSSPQGGQYGDSFLKTILHNTLKKTAHDVFYKSSGQKYSTQRIFLD